MQAYRLVKKKWASTALDGEGAKRYGGRWNSRGVPCLYLAGSESLALLEIMVHLEDHALLEHYALFQLDVPQQAILHLSPDALPENWREEPAPADTAAIGDEWLRRGASLALAVPSVVVPRELNYLINPAHPQFDALTRTVRRLEFLPDARLLNRGAV